MNGHAQILKIALRGLGARKGRAVLMMAGVSVGILALTLAVAVTRGAAAQVERNIQSFGPDAIMVAAGSPQMQGPGDERVTTLVPEDLVALRDEVSGIAVASPMVVRVAQPVSREDKNRATMIVGSTPEYEDAWDWHVQSGEFLSEAQEASLARVAVLGRTVSRDLFGAQDPVGQWIQIRDGRFRVIGVAAARGTSPLGMDMDDRIVIPLSTAMRRVFNVTYYSMVRLRVRPNVDVERTAGTVTGLMRERHHVGLGETEDFAVRTATTLRGMAEKVAATLRLLLGIVSLVSLAAGGVVLANIMLVSISERRAEIGIRRAVGATRAQIAQQFLVEGMVVTAIGGAVGAVVGAAATAVMRAAGGLPVPVSWEPFVIGLVVSLLVGAFASLIPARRAASVAIVDALRP